MSARKKKMQILRKKKKDKNLKMQKKKEESQKRDSENLWTEFERMLKKRSYFGDDGHRY